MDSPIDVDRLARVETEVADVERALYRLDEGSYGSCEVCGAELEDERLADIPIVRTCGAHS